MVSLLASGLCSCSASGFLPGDETSLKRKGEKVTVTITNGPGVKAPSAVPGAGPLSAAALVSPAVNIAIKTISAELGKEAGLYSASYMGSASDDQFWSNDGSVRLESIELKREANLSTEKNPKEDTACVLTFGAERSFDGTAVRLYPKSVDYRYTKAKRPPGKDKIDLSITITIDAFWLNKDGEISSKTIATLPLLLPKVPVGVAAQKKRPDYAASAKKMKTGWFSVPRSIKLQSQNDVLAASLSSAAAKSAEDAAEKARETLATSPPDKLDENKKQSENLDKYAAKMKALAAHDAGAASQLGNGTYAVTIVVKEVDEFGDKVTEFKSTFDQNSDVLKKLLGGS
jgi:hypothetical protein